MDGQTPQGFGYGDILAAHRAAHASAAANLTDDASVAERAGIALAMVPGRIENRKLTTAEDIEQADRLMTSKQFAERSDIRMGQGIDIHSFEAGDAVTLLGVRIPYHHRLKGHSDADAAMHALTDAIFGAIGEGESAFIFRQATHVEGRRPLASSSRRP